MTILVIRIDISQPYLEMIISQLVRKFPVTILERKEVADEPERKD